MTSKPKIKCCLCEESQESLAKTGNGVLRAVFTNRGLEAMCNPCWHNAIEQKK